MKVLPTQGPGARETAKKPFTEVLKQAKPASGAPPKVAPQPTNVARAQVTAQTVRPAAPQRVQPHAMPAKQLAQARVHVDAEAKRLGAVRSDHSHAASAMTQARTERGEQLDEKQSAKLMDALTQELSKDPQPPPPVMPAAKPELATNATVKVDAAPETKAAHAAALIEKIEHFVRSNRPGLSITLNNSLGARVELERIGPKELSVKLFGKPGHEAVGRIRDELRARGLNARLIVV